jgi:hypothetical protein
MVCAMSTPDDNNLSAIIDTFSALKDRLGALGFSGAGKVVPPLGPLAPSPALAPGAPSTTGPYRTPAGAPAAAPPPAEPPPLPSPQQPLRPFWSASEGTPRERLSTDGRERLAYETSTSTDACGGPRWDRVALPLSPDAEAKLASYVGMGPALLELVGALQRIAEEGEGRTSAEIAAAAHNTLAKLGLAYPLQRATSGRVAHDNRAPGDLVSVLYPECTVVVVSCSVHPALGDIVEQIELGGELRYRGRVVRVAPKDKGYDLTLADMFGGARSGPFTIRRPTPSE